MKIHTVNANAVLMERLAAIRSEHEAWRVVHLKLSKMPPRRNPMLFSHFILKNIKESLALYEGSVFVCNDGDIIILFQGRVQPVLGNLADYFADIPSIEDGEGTGGVVSVYDLSRDWAYFYSLCFRKASGQDTHRHPHVARAHAELAHMENA